MNIPHKRVGHLVENVVMERGEADSFASKLNCNMVMLDSQDLGLISRPRLWWSRVGWSTIRTSPITGAADTDPQVLQAALSRTSA